MSREEQFNTTNSSHVQLFRAIPEPQLHQQVLIGPANIFTKAKQQQLFNTKLQGKKIELTFNDISV